MYNDPFKVIDYGTNCMCDSIVLHSRNVQGFACQNHLLAPAPCSGEGFRVFPWSRSTNYPVNHHTNHTASYLGILATTSFWLKLI